MKDILSFFSGLFSKPDSAQTYHLSQEQRDQISSELGNLKNQNVQLQQSLREKTAQSAANTEDLFLELLEVVDAVEALIEYLDKNPNPSPEFLQRLPKTIGAVHRKFLSVLAKRQVLPIEIQEGTQPNFKLCRVVAREVRDDLAEQTITKIIRRGFILDEKVLRSTEVITSKLD